MATFLNKKEQVYDLKLTNYGHYLLSIGKLEPVYYAFMDDNIIYDGKYAGVEEKQNEILNRIKNESQYLEGLVTFQDPENQFTKLGSIYSDKINPDDVLLSGVENPTFFDVDINPQRIQPRVDNYVYSAIIGDAYLEGGTQLSPAWKLVALEGEITSTQQEDVLNNIRIPQINIDVSYVKEIQPYDPTIIVEEQDMREVVTTSAPFADDMVVKVRREDLMVYGEEVNTELLTQNFDVEIFEIIKNAYPPNPLYADYGVAPIAVGKGPDFTPFVDSPTVGANAGSHNHASYDEKYFKIVVPSGWNMSYESPSHNGIQPIPSAAAVQYILKSSLGSAPTPHGSDPVPRKIYVGIGSDFEDMRDNIIAAINGTADDTRARYENDDPERRPLDLLAYAIDDTGEPPPYSWETKVTNDALYTAHVWCDFMPDDNGVDQDWQYFFRTITNSGLVGFDGGVAPIFNLGRDVLKRKYFPTDDGDILGGNMEVVRAKDGSLRAVNQKPTIQTQTNETLGSDAVAYYFDFVSDDQIPAHQACKLASQFNRNSYYVDLDFECNKFKEAELLHVDIYGKVTEPEICL